MREIKNILVTGGCGFIGSNFIRYVFNKTDFKGNLVNIDALTYAGNPLNLIDIGHDFPERYVFKHMNIGNTKDILKILEDWNIDTIFHFAAESHVDRSIKEPDIFIETNVKGTFSILEAIRTLSNKILLVHVSTDEVFGSLVSDDDYFFEYSSYDPRSPYSASKASADHMVRAYYHTFGLPAIISNCSNNYGPYQFPEKLIPLAIINMINEKPIPVYGDGKNVRDWVYVEDHCSALWLMALKGKIGESYNVSGENEWENIKLIETLCDLMNDIKSREYQHYRKLITFVKDRPGHDHRYAMNCDKIKNELNWKRSWGWSRGLVSTVYWYIKNGEWVQNIKDGSYKQWIQEHYDGLI